MNTPKPTPRTDAEITFTGAYTCTHHNDQQRAVCPVCLVTTLTAERDQLRADCENETKWAAHYLADALAAKARAERAEAQLAAEREKVGVLREALENLRDEQNGVPLYTREEQWKQAMDGAEAALAATEAKP